MAKKQMKIGDSVLLYGNELQITGLEERGTDDGLRTVAVVEDVDGLKERQAAVEEFNEIREREAAFVELLGIRKHLRAGTTDESERERLEARRDELEAMELPSYDEAEAMRARLDELNKKASEALFRLKLRADLLHWWQDRGVWVSEGRILSDQQRELYQKLMGTAPAPEGERAALAFLNYQDNGGN